LDWIGLRFFYWVGSVLNTPDIDNISDVWKELKERFSRADRIRVWKLKSEINNLKQGTSSVNDYYAELRSF